MRGLILLIGSLTFLWAEKLTLALDWIINPHHLPIVVAMEKGFFGTLDIDLIVTSSTEEASKLLLSKRADLAIASQPRHMLRILHKKMPLVYVGTLIPVPLEVVLSHVPLQEIKSIGHASSGVGFSELALSQLFSYLKCSGNTNPQKFYLKNGLSPAFIQKHLDAIMNICRTYQLWDIQKFYQKPFYIYPLEAFGVPIYAEMIFVAHEENKELNKIRIFLSGLKKAIIFVKKNPQESLEILKNRYPEHKNLTLDQIKSIISYFENDPFNTYPDRNDKLKVFLIKS